MSRFFTFMRLKNSPLRHICLRVRDVKRLSILFSSFICVYNLLLILMAHSQLDRDGLILIQTNTLPLRVLPESNPLPWDPIDAELETVLLSAERSTLFPSNTDDFNLEGIITVENIESATSTSKSCSRITQRLRPPIGIPRLNGLHRRPFHKSTPQMCLLHSPGFMAGASLFNDKQFFLFSHSLNQKLVAEKSCYRNKTAKSIVESLYFDAGGQKGVNLVILLTGDAPVSFQHFAAWIPVRYAMINEWLLKIAAETQVLLNITIATHLESVISKQFWSAVGFERGVRIINERVNVTLFDVALNWCGNSVFTFYAPLLIAPFVFNVHELRPPESETLTPMYSWNAMRSIKSSLSNVGVPRDTILYLSRNRKSCRHVLNEEAVIQLISAFAAKVNLALHVRTKRFSQEEGGFAAEKALFSRSVLAIGAHGGSFANLMFMQYGSDVLEFNGWLQADARPWSYALAQANGLNYFYLAPNNFSYKDNSRHMTINLNNLDEMLWHIHAKRAAGMNVL